MGRCCVLVVVVAAAISLGCGSSNKPQPSPGLSPSAVVSSTPITPVAVQASESVKTTHRVECRYDEPIEQCIMTNHLECEKVAPKEQCDAVDAIMLDRGWRPIGEYVTDMTGDGIAEILVHAIPFGCGSCHGQAVMVMQGEELLFDRAADDAEVSIRPPFPPTGFWLKEPVRIEGEGLCCPSAYLEARFEWDGETFSRPNTDQ